MADPSYKLVLEAEIESLVRFLGALGQHWASDSLMVVSKRCDPGLPPHRGSFYSPIQGVCILSLSLSLWTPVIFIVTLLIISCKSHKLLSLFHIVTVLYSSFLLSAALIGRASVLPFEFAHPPPSFSLLLKPIYCIFQSVVFFSSVISGSKAQNLPR